MASFQAAATSYATWSRPMLPFFLFYSMFGFQRIGDLIWQCADARGRGFLLGCTAGRTTLSGEGLQHEDGQSLLQASTVPNIRAYDPAFAYELATIIEDGINEMYGPNGKDVLYYLTLYNENYVMPDFSQHDLERVREGVIRGLYRFADAKPIDMGFDVKRRGLRRATLLFSGSAWHETMRARDILASDWGVAAEAWSVTSYKALREDALEAERWNRLHPLATPRVAYVTSTLAVARGPIVAVTDFMKAVPDQISRFVTAPFVPLGTDGFGRSDTREALRTHFEIDAEHIVVAVLSQLAQKGSIKGREVAEAIERYSIDTEVIDPRLA